jgi:membrane fusion protein (multidrug efflux system)
MQKRILLFILPVLLHASCGGKETAGGPQRHGAPGNSQARGGRPSDQHGGGTPGGTAPQAAAVPVEVAAVERRDISAYIETNGILEAENEVDVVARTSGPIVALEAEEGMLVRRGKLLARIDDLDVRSNVEIARVALNEARLNYERSKKLHEGRLISPEEYEQAANRFETAQAQYENNRILLGYTEIKAPFSGRIVTRYVDLAQQVSPGTSIFRISDFDPLLCPIQVPERELPRLALGQSAYLTVEAWAGERFPAKVLRISPVVDAATGTVKVTLDVEPDERLRPGMFTRVFLETEKRPESLIIPKTALSLESLGDTVYVADGDVALRREVSLGFREGDFVEIVGGLAEGDLVVVVGQDGLSDGTPIQVLGGGDTTAPMSVAGRRKQDRSPAGPGDAALQDQREGPGGATGGGSGRRMDPSQMTPEQLERAKELMRARGLSETEIEQRLEQRRNRSENSDDQ